MLVRCIATAVSTALLLAACSESPASTPEAPPLHHQAVETLHDAPTLAETPIDTNVLISADGEPAVPAVGYVEVVAKIGGQPVSRIAFRTEWATAQVGFQATIGNDLDSLDRFARGDAKSLIGRFVRFDSGSGVYLRPVQDASIRLPGDDIIEVELELGNARFISTMEEVDMPSSTLAIKGRFSFGCGVLVPDPDGVLETDAPAAAGTVLADPNGTSSACAEVYQLLSRGDAQ